MPALDPREAARASEAVELKRLSEEPDVPPDDDDEVATQRHDERQEEGEEELGENGGEP